MTNKSKKYGTRKLLRMLVEWHESLREPVTQQAWWDRYPALSCNDVVALARRALNKKRRQSQKKK